jgi:hypothetical protein
MPTLSVITYATEFNKKSKGKKAQHFTKNYFPVILFSRENLGHSREVFNGIEKYGTKSFPELPMLYLCSSF